MIYTNFVDFRSLIMLMLHAKFQSHRPSSTEEEDFFNFFAIYSHGGQLGHVTLTIYINFHFHSQMLHTKFQNHRPSGSEEEDF